LAVTHDFPELKGDEGLAEKEDDHHRRDRDGQDLGERANENKSAHETGEVMSDWSVHGFTSIRHPFSSSADRLLCSSALGGMWDVKGVFSLRSRDGAEEGSINRMQNEAAQDAHACVGRVTAEHATPGQRHDNDFHG